VPTVSNTRFWPFGIGLALALMLVSFPGVASADVVREAQWHLIYLRMSDAMKSAKGSGVVVAVVDSGVDSSHPDLAGAVLSGTDVGGSGDGQTDVNGHGTGVAGLVAARGRPDGSGALGIAPGAAILPVRAGGAGNPLIAEAVDWAVLNGAKVICIALVIGPNRTLESAIRHAIDSDVVVVAGAGNDPNGGVQAPARYSGVVAAVGIDRQGSRASFSPIGKESVLAAPAVDIVSTNAGGGYFKSFGTSDATAIIAGVAALVRSKFPQLSAREVVHRMTATAIDKGKPGRDDEYGYGIVNPVGALTADVRPLSESPAPGSPAVGAQPQEPASEDSSALGWIVGVVLLAAAGVGTTIAIRRAAR
jgi:type VII secretion-associated serine protease mycosin